MDTQAPTISNVTITGEGDDAALSFDVTDSSPIAGYGFSMAANGEASCRRRNTAGASSEATVHATTTTTSSSRTRAARGR